MAWHYRNWRRERVADGRRLEYRGWNIEGNHKLVSYLKEEENLESLD